MGISSARAPAAHSRDRLAIPGFMNASAMYRVIEALTPVVSSDRVIPTWPRTSQHLDRGLAIGRM